MVTCAAAVPRIRERALGSRRSTTRAHVLTHVARNADAMANLIQWARTGTPTPAYASREQRDADIAAGAKRSPADIRANESR